MLLFSLFCMTYSYRIMGSDNYVLHTIFPTLSWYITIRLEYMTLFSSIGLYALYTVHLYPLDVNRKVVYAIAAFCFGFTLAALVLPPYYFTQLINPFLVVMIYCLIYTPWVYYKAYKRRRPGSQYAMLSVSVLMIVFAISLGHYWGYLPPLAFISFCCYMIFFFLQSLILSYHVSFNLNVAKQVAEESSRAKSDFLSTMTHEIRTPLNAVIGLTHLLLKGNPREEQAEYLDVMLFSTNNLLSIVNDVLDYNKIEAGKITFEKIEMDMAMIIRNIAKGMQITAADKGLEMRVNIDTALQTKVMGDPTRTTQIISNLVNNAIKFTSSGYIEVGAEVTNMAKHHVTLKVWVKDTGIGIAEDKHKLIFERFTQADSSISRSFGGTGLGLSISKKMLELQNSTLQLNSKVGEGSTFYFVQRFELPEKQVSKPIPVDAAADDKPFTGINILLVDDNQMNILIAQTYLKKWGATVDVASNGQEALDRFDHLKHRLILLDLHMPVLDGYETAKIIRSNGINTPIIALTANLPGEVADYAASTGMDDVVGKPFLPDELFNKVHKFVAATEVS
ncbi:ATP-binding protein [Mucilaginibacter ginkgonis]|uniref:ATP-binding protein n=1 Tax=Mucilaginibacter ginkgonis TaxID=2682091 RepID=UPI001FC7BFB7|nr:ATP-binding protein [Mucilaginibacter ginkgonis]